MGVYHPIFTIPVLVYQILGNATYKKEKNAISIAVQRWDSVHFFCLKCRIFTGKCYARGSQRPEKHL
jgi:hypothetical protein